MAKKSPRNLEIVHKNNQPNVPKVLNPNNFYEKDEMQRSVFIYILHAVIDTNGFINTRNQNIHLSIDFPLH